ncbi:MAG TPA: UDP-N-acetylmuramoyl-tripeptide--D-alanyl-D-alanine ligase [Candidatus Nanopelagicaceae bacterium]|nr:UDP-N-acetylmuramoyl-tripeptide--D-alanyl-D-alanine ligase [Candidatus Nanopelagicaceae bacterium]
MIPLTLNEIAKIVDGRILNATGEEIVNAPAFVDTRKILVGGLFVALLGEHVDGHDFASDAIRDGAVAALVSRDVGVPSVLVSDVLPALQSLARHVRTSLTELKVIGITGSQGKTTTKDMLFAILKAEALTIAPPGNLNNEIGVPLTLLRCTSDTVFCITEMGARHEGDIKALAEIAKVNVGAVLNIGTSHVGEFGSEAALARTKGELIASLESDGVAVLGGYDQATLKLRAIAGDRVAIFGEGSDADVRGDQISLVEGKARFMLSADGKQREIQLNYFGRHQVANALAAATIARELGLDLAKIASALSTALPQSRWRMEVRARERDKVTIINDAYNANPESMAAAVELLAEWAAADGRPSWAVLGQMHELGASSGQAHRFIGRLVGRLGINHLLVVGSGSEEIANGAREMAVADVMSVSDLAAARHFFNRHVEAGALVLVKASRAEGLERLATELVENPI